nr:pleckstrin homology-like domain family B member 2 [Maniola hyperantus]
MKSVLPSGHVSMAPIQFQPNEQCVPTGYVNHNTDPSSQCYQHSLQHLYRDTSLSFLDHELDMTLKEMSRKKPPLAPKKPHRDLDASDSNSDQESRPKIGSIMAKVSKFEYYAKQHKNVGRSQFYTTNEIEISPKVFSSNSLTVNTPAKDVLGSRHIPNYMNKRQDQKMIVLSENNLDTKNCSYTNVAPRQNNKTRIDDIVRNFDDTTRNDTKLPKKVNNDQQGRPDQHIYGKINTDRKDKNHLDCKNDSKNLNLDIGEYGRLCGVGKVVCLSSPSYEHNPQYSPVYANCYERSVEAETMRKKAHQDRVKEEEQKDAETARLEEILTMCAEYERQIASGVPITPTEKRPHNKIITNGSLPRSVTLTNPNFVQTSDGYYKFETSHSRSSPVSQSLPIQRNLSSYENFDTSQSPKPECITPEVSITDNNYQNVGRMDELGIPVFDEMTRNDLSSPLMIRKLQNQSPIGSPYENVYYKNNIGFKPKSPNTQSPRTRIKTSFAHKNLPSPQYFIFPSPVDGTTKPFADTSINTTGNNSTGTKPNCEGIEKQLSLEEEIPMIDDADLTNDIEFRYSKIIEKNDDSTQNDTETDKTCIDLRYAKIDTLESKDETDENEVEYAMVKNKSFDDVKNELMADIPELEEFEKELKQNKREKMIRTITGDIKRMDVEDDSFITVLDETVEELKSKYENLKEERRKLVTQIHEIKCKMTEIRSQEDDILRELEMEKALIKGEYDSEIAILNIEQKKRAELVVRAKKIEEEIRQLKEKQELRHSEMKDRVEIATLKAERIEKDLKENKATLEELQNAQDILDNETKISEDLEFQHLEEESELLANREDLQNEIMLLSKKIEAQKTRILTLKSEANNNLTSALEETKVLQAEYVKLLNQVEHLTGKVQLIEKELKPVVAKLNDIERTQSPDSAFYTDQTRAKSGEFGSSPQSSDSDDLDVAKVSNFEDHTKLLKDKFNSIDQMSQSMIVDIERRVTTDLDDPIEVDSSPSKSSNSSKEKKGFWERNFDSLKRKSKDKKKSEKVDIMSQSLNENIFFNDNIEVDVSLDKFNSLRNSKKKDKKENGPVKSNSSSKIPTFAALGKIIKKDSLKRKEMNAQKDKDKERDKQIQNQNEEAEQNNVKIRYVKNFKPIIADNKYVKSKSLSPDKISSEAIKEEEESGGVCKRSERSAKMLHRKSCGDEPNVRSDFHKITDSGKIPSQDDIDRISKVTMDAPILSSDTDVSSLGKRTLDSLMEIERKRMEMLEEKGCQVIEDEREKISELKKRVQDETKKLWDQRAKEMRADSRHQHVSSDLAHLASAVDCEDRLGGGLDNVSFEDPFNVTNSTIYEESSGFMSSSIEELQVRTSRTDSAEDDSRPLSRASDFSRDNVLCVGSAPRRSRRGLASEWQRPLTRYLPVDRDDFDLRRHVESAGHQVELCPYVTVNSASCRGYLHKLGAKFHTWSKRWFVFDRETKTFVYYWDKSEKKPRGGAYFQVIEEVYLDHGNTSKSPNPQTTFIVKTRQRRYYLMAPSGEAARIWIDVIFTGAQGYTEYLE